MTNDLREATVFHTVFGDVTEVADSAKALASATGVLRSTVGQQTAINFVPTLSFVADIVPDNARELDAALERVRTPTPNWPAPARGRRPGGRDPYRRPAEDDDDERRRCGGRRRPGDALPPRTSGARCPPAGPGVDELPVRSQQCHPSRSLEPDPVRRGHRRRQARSWGGPTAGHGDPTDGGKRGEIGRTPSIAADEPDGGGPHTWPPAAVRSTDVSARTPTFFGPGRGMPIGQSNIVPRPGPPRASDRESTSWRRRGTSWPPWS